MNNKSRPGSAPARFVNGRLEGPELFTDLEVCALLRKRRETLYHWRKAGILKALVVGGSLLYPREEVERLLVMETAGQMSDTIEIGGVWLLRQGVEGEGDAVVLVKVDGEWREAIREDINGNFSHCAHPSGIRAAKKADI